MKNKFYIAPSILSADLLKLQKQVELVEQNGASFLHVDVMDGHFVPNLTFGPEIVRTLKRVTRLPLDVHLMIKNPDNSLSAYAEAGADILTVHQEACVHLHRTLQIIHQLGLKAGVSLNPATSLVTIENVLTDIDLLLIMTVNPGFGGQSFIPQSMQKIARARKMIDAIGKDILLEVDGGVNENNIAALVKQGARILVAGNAVFAQPDVAGALQNLIRAGSEVL